MGRLSCYLEKYANFLHFAILYNWVFLKTPLLWDVDGKQVFECFFFVPYNVKLLVQTT